MKDKTFLIMNACCWMAVLFVSAEPIANIITELWQAYLMLAFCSVTMWLAWHSMRMAERRTRNGKGKN